jgi:DtxR family Mn-dependent transcriptional regulator
MYSLIMLLTGWLTAKLLPGEQPMFYMELMAMGILPGADIRLLRLFPSYIFEIGQSQFTVDRQLAEKIFVHWQT